MFFRSLKRVGFDNTKYPKDIQERAKPFLFNKKSTRKDCVASVIKTKSSTYAKFSINHLRALPV
ncbi:hypothetical protein AD951_08475 [Acetobacter malorum]|uniref:Uncharacterized protein n=1 Tax=Acetobacter malorum TaxID=178901 RepID=A0A149UM38_9PROT|nr:hypothetical protein AD951_08475 [Acetobacter malorum]